MSERIQEEVMDICVAYEEGYAVADQGISSDLNKYPANTKEYYAWYYGHTNSLTNQLLQGEDSLDIVFEME